MHAPRQPHIDLGQRCRADRRALVARVFPRDQSVGAGFQGLIQSVSGQSSLKPAISSYIVAPSMDSRMMSAWPACRVSSSISAARPSAPSSGRCPAGTTAHRAAPEPGCPDRLPRRPATSRRSACAACRAARSRVSSSRITYSSAYSAMISSIGRSSRGGKSGAAADPFHPAPLHAWRMLDQTADRQRADRRLSTAPAHRSSRRPRRRTRSG